MTKGGEMLRHAKETQPPRVQTIDLYGSNVAVTPQYRDNICL
jgi:hypothetical protein